MKVSAFAPATIANLSCGFDVLGLSLDNHGDTVEVSFSEEPGVKIVSIDGDNGRLPLEASQNTSGVAVLQFLNLCKERSHKIESEGFSIKIKKGLPLGSGLGSSAASSVAALVAVNQLCGNKFSRQELLACAMESERVACGSAHADNVAPCLLGGIILIRSYEPLDVIKLDFPEDLYCVVVSPHIELKTSDSRRVLRKQIRLSAAIKQWGNIAGLVAGLLKKDYGLISRSLVDDLIEPERAILIPGFYAVKAAALDSGALGCSISGSGPSVFALAQCKGAAEAVSVAMQQQFLKLDIESTVTVSLVNPEGARIISQS